MAILRLTVSSLFFGLLQVGSHAVYGQNFPNKPIRIVTSGTGGASDFTARFIAQALPAGLGVPVIVDNRAESIASETAAQAQPDGYTLLVGANPLWIGQLLQKKSYDVVRDFLPISCTNQSPVVLVIPATMAVSSVSDLIALAKARPGALNYASAGAGSGSHLAAELLKNMAGVDIVGVNYKGVGPAINDLIGGRVELMAVSASAVMPHIRAGRLKALAVTSSQPSILAAGLPTVAASGLPGYEVTSVVGLLAPAKTPATLIARLNQEVIQVLTREDVKDQFSKSGFEIVGSSPEQFGLIIRSEIAKWGKLIKDAGIRVD